MQEQIQDIQNSDRDCQPDEHSPKDYDYVFGSTWRWSKDVPFGVNRDDLNYHLYCLGQTGTGKSSFLKELLAQIIQAGEGCAFIDPHGPTSLELLEYIPPDRRNDVYFFDPSDTEFPISLNPFYRVPKDERALVALNIVSCMAHIWHDSWGAHTERIWFNIVRALLDAPDHLRPTFTALPLMLNNKTYRNAVLRHVDDDEIKDFFRTSFDPFNDEKLADRLGSTENKLSQFLANPFVKNVLGSWRPTLDIADIMANKKILIVRLSKGMLGDVPANLTASLIATQIQQTAMNREKFQASVYPNFVMAIDEIHNVMSDIQANGLSEVRKYKLSLIGSNQFIEQIKSHQLRSAIFGNVGNIISFRVSEHDAEILSKELGHFPPARYTDMRTGAVNARLISKGQPNSLIHGNIELGTAHRYNFSQAILKFNREKNTRPRALVEENIKRFKYHIGELKKPTRRKKKITAKLKEKVKADQEKIRSLIVKKSEARSSKK